MSSTAFRTLSTLRCDPWNPRPIPAEFGTVSVNHTLPICTKASQASKDCEVECQWNLYVNLAFPTADGRPNSVNQQQVCSNSDVSLLSIFVDRRSVQQNAVPDYCKWWMTDHNVRFGRSPVYFWQYYRCTESNWRVARKIDFRLVLGVFIGNL